MSPVVTKHTDVIISTTSGLRLTGSEFYGVFRAWNFSLINLPQKFFWYLLPFFRKNCQTNSIKKNGFYLMLKWMPLDTGRLSFGSIFGGLLPPLPLLRTWLFFFFDAFHFWFFFRRSIRFRFALFALGRFGFFFDAWGTLSRWLLCFLFCRFLLWSVIPIRTWIWRIKMVILMVSVSFPRKLCIFRRVATFRLINNFQI